MSSIADILIEQGRVLADQRLRTGARRGALVTGLGQIPIQIVAGRQAAAEAARFAAEKHMEAQQAAALKQAAEERAQADLVLRQNADARAQAAVDQPRLDEERGRNAVMGWMKQHAATLKPDEADRMTAIMQMPGGTKHLVEQLSKAPEPFTLNPGDVRYDAAGTQIAANPKPIEPPKPAAEHLITVPGPNGRPISRLATADELRAGVETYRAPTQSSGGSGDAEDATAIAEAIARGEQPPVTTGLFRLAGPVRAALATKGYNLAAANLDWQATQKHLSTLNGAQQTRMAQAIDNAAHSLDVIDDLATQWDGGKFPILNKAQLVLAKGGALGPKAQQLATQLEAQISDVTSELGNVYMGGNSPTDHALTLAAKNLSADWTKDQLKAALSLARRNLTIRQNSIRNAGVAGASDNNVYAPPQAPPAPTGAIVVTAPDGSTHPFDTQAQADAFKKLAGIK